MSNLCFCKRPPRELIARYAVCACPHLVYTPSRLIGPMTPWDTWVPRMDANLRKQLVAMAKARVGLDEPSRIAPQNLVAAVEAARMANENRFADDLEYEQWVASL